MEPTTQHYGVGTAAGFKGISQEARETGREAAEEVTRTLERRHRQMLDAWAPYGATGAIPEQIADDLGIPLLCVRPRAGELVKRGLLFEVGKRTGAWVPRSWPTASSSPPPTNCRRPRDGRGCANPD